MTPYPSTQPRRKKPQLTLVPAREPEFGNTQQEWEERIFRAANHFNVIRYGVPAGSECATVKTYPEAIHLAYDNPRALIYAVTLAGHAFCIPRKEYEKYSAVWLEIAGKK